MDADYIARCEQGREGYLEPAREIRVQPLQRAGKRLARSAPAVCPT
jgi:hypothetical protein